MTLRYVTDSENLEYCSRTNSRQFTGSMALSDDYWNDRPQWLSFVDGLEHTLFWSTQYDSWVLNTGHEGSVALQPMAAVLRSVVSDDRGLLIPPGRGIWMAFITANTLEPDCLIELLLSCGTLSSPTLKPTTHAPTGFPTTGHPTRFPTFSPTDAPSAAPSLAPSAAPSFSPTAAPIVSCDGLNITGTEHQEMDGLYITKNETKNGRPQWKALLSDAEVFYSTFDKWTLSSIEVGVYFFLEENPSLQPPQTANWEEFLGNSPFSINNKELNFICQADPHPTPAPTQPPTRAPTNFSHQCSLSRTH